MTYDLTTSAGKVRLLISDVDASAEVFNDDEIDTFLDLRGDSVMLAAALALRTIAANEALLSKVVTTGDGLSTDGAKVATALTALADRYESTIDADADFDYAEVAPQPFGPRRRIAAEFLRGL